MRCRPLVSVIQINRYVEPDDADSPGLYEHRYAEATDFDQVFKAFDGADCVIHLAAHPRPFLDASDVEVLTANTAGS